MIILLLLLLVQSCFANITFIKNNLTDLYRNNTNTDTINDPVMQVLLVLMCAIFAVLFICCCISCTMQHNNSNVDPCLCGCLLGDCCYSIADHYGRF